MTKALLGYGARLPKELMLFVKNMVFLDGAIATLAPDLDLFAEIASISTYFAETHGERIAEEVGIDRRRLRHRPDRGEGLASASTPPTERLTYRELQERRELIRSRFQNRQVSRARQRPGRDVAGAPASIARCSVDYAGRLTAHLPLATRLIMVKADGCVAIHADGGAYKPLNWMNSAQPADRAARPHGW